MNGSDFYGRSYEGHLKDIAEQEEREGGRRPLTVGDLKRIIADMPDDLPVKVLHQPRCQRVGFADPVCKRSPIANCVGYDMPRGAPIFGDEGVEYLFFW